MVSRRALNAAATSGIKVTWRSGSKAIQFPSACAKASRHVSIAS
jgi:hypothetical protein